MESNREIVTLFQRVMELYVPEAERAAYWEHFDAWRAEHNAEVKRHVLESINLHKAGLLVRLEV
jgi:hypothetical protein